ncbi:hypothetical protein FSARC_12459 [Fusarium sarcochroum]|uniref:Chromo domain-containing protein n=1 Tax=Fusarium sarcochroum TaxID=1208366 RepID=A0A8H4WX21_9HYPO|nr:hypothetical protein FSARC_12459 [Fusarium sarcochroum]
MVRTRKKTDSPNKRKPRVSLNRKSKRKRDDADGEEDYIDDPTARKRGKSGVSKRGRLLQDEQGDSEHQSQAKDSQEIEKGDIAEHGDTESDSDKGWFAIRAIIDERPAFNQKTRKWKTEYLVDWENSSKGKAYPTEWRLAVDITSDALKEWKQGKEDRERKEIKYDKKRLQKRQKRGLQSTESSALHAESTAVSNRRQLQTLDASTQRRSRSDSFDKDVRSKDRTRTQPEDALSEEPVPSLSASAEDVESVDSNDFNLRRGQQVAIVLRKPDNFDASEYQSINETQGSSQRISDLEDNDQRVAFASQLSQGTIPDSQDLSSNLWDQRDTESQLAAPGVEHEPDNSRIPEDQQSVAADHLEPVDQVEDIPSQEEQNVHVENRPNAESQPVEVPAATPDLLGSDGLQDPQLSEDDHSYHDNGGYNDVAAADFSDDDQSLDVHSIRDDQDRDDIEVTGPADNQTVEADRLSSQNSDSHQDQLSRDSQVPLDSEDQSNEQDCLDVESTQDTHHSPERQSTETANSQTSQAPVDSLDSHIGRGHQVQDRISVDQHSEDTQQVIEDHVSEAVASPSPEQDTHGDQQVTSSHRPATAQGRASDRQLQFEETAAASQSSDNRDCADTISSLKSPSHSKAVELQGQPSSSDQDSDIGCIIPDSQDRSNTSDLHASATRALTVLSQHQVTPVASQIEIVPDSATTGSDIPSRQPDRPRLLSVEKQDSFDSPRDCGAHRTVETAPAAKSPVSNTQNQPVYFTQPQVPRGSPDIPSSLSSKIAFSEAEPTVSENSQTNPASQHRANLEEDTQESQAAQIVSRPSRSQSRNNVNQETGPGGKLKLTPGYTRSYSPEQRSNLRFQTSSASEPPQLPRSASIIRAMESSASKPRGSAVDELKSFIDFGKDSLTQVEDPTDHPGDTSYGAPSEQEPTSTGGHTMSLDVVVDSPEPLVQSQPVYSVDPWKPEALGNTPEAPAPSISPASIMANPQMSAVESLHKVINIEFGDSEDSIEPSLLGLGEIPPETISPAVINRLADPVDSTHTLTFQDQDTMPSEVESSGHSITMGQIPAEDDSDASSERSGKDPGITQHIVTLPMQTSRRSYYEAIIKDHKADIQSFSSFFTGGSHERPSKALLQRIDELFNTLLNICDYPPDVIGTELEKSDSSTIAKYSCDANAKFSFLFEFMTGLGGEGKRVLIVARSPELLRLIFHLTVAAKIECSAESINERTDYPSNVLITLALRDEDFDPFNFNVVIGFDHYFTNSFINKQLYDEEARTSPLVLQLVTTSSIEHIGLVVFQGVEDDEQKHVFLACTISAVSYLEDPNRDYKEPHEVAEIFANYLNSNDGTLNWQPQTIPDDVLDIFENPTSQSQRLFADDALLGNGLKRKYSDDDEDSDAKRIRLPLRDLPVDCNNPPIPLAVRQMLDDAVPRGEVKEMESTCSVSVATLKSITEKMNEYKRQNALAGEMRDEYKITISRLEKELKDHRRTMNKVELSNRAALQDRTMFEKEKQKADTAAQAAAEKAQKESEKQQLRIQELESTIARLKENPESAEREKEFEEAQKKLQDSEKKRTYMQSDLDFMKNRYQDVDAQAHRLANENKELKAQHEDMAKKASVNILEINRHNAATEQRALQQQIAGLQAHIQQQQAELVSVHQKLANFANGRNTRGGSMPRSPRVPSGMSPRPGRGFAGSASRGTSPAGPGPQFMGQQPGNGRWNRLQ